MNNKPSYILRKEMPGLKVGTKVIWVDSEKAYFPEENGYNIAAHIVQCHPDFFKLEDWKIVSMIDCHENIVIDDENTIDLWLQGYEKEMFKINSIKRLPDEQIFTVKDTINCDTCSPSFSRQTIERFIITPDYGIRVCCAGVSCSLNEISKCITPDSNALEISDPKVYTEKEVLQIEADAFKAGATMIATKIVYKKLLFYTRKTFNLEFLFKDFSAYKNKINE